MSKPHLQLVSDFPLGKIPRTQEETADDYITLLYGWQIALVLSSIMMTSAAIGMMGTYWWLMSR